MIKRSRAIFFGLLIVLTLLYIGGCRNVGVWLVREDVPSHADAIVLLMGTFPERVLQAVDLYHRGLADNMIIVYESMGPYQTLGARGASVKRTTEQARDAAVALGVPEARITMVPGDARSTLDEAIAVRDHLVNRSATDTLILVSSPAHMRRSYIIFRNVLGKKEHPVYIGCSPSVYSGFNPDKWWRRKEDVQAVLSEYVKICSFHLFEKKGLR
ncbi:MAG TPA: hypothetical protein DDW27_17210 [Bacteroidales bacterium]|nr:hypothetical protein [Bacteroidales bacterium]